MTSALGRKQGGEDLRLGDGTPSEVLGTLGARVGVIVSDVRGHGEGDGVADAAARIGGLSRRRLGVGLSSGGSVLTRDQRRLLVLLHLLADPVEMIKGDDSALLEGAGTAGVLRRSARAGSAVLGAALQEHAGGRGRVDHDDALCRSDVIVNEAD